MGYGLSKFDKAFVKSFGFDTKQHFYEYLVALGIAETTGVIKNRQDLFDGMSTSPNARKGWWQKGDVYKFRWDYIDSLFGRLDVNEFVEVVKLSILEITKDNSIKVFEEHIKPITKSLFHKMQKTGLEAEIYFSQNYRKINEFSRANIDDARLLGDGYDFQVNCDEQFFLAEIKGIRGNNGGIRMTNNEYLKAKEYGEKYSLIIVKELDDIPRMTAIFNPIYEIDFSIKEINSRQTYYTANI